MTTSPIRQDKTETNAQSSSASLNKRPIWEIVAEIGAQIPDEDWATVPNDTKRCFDQLQTYLYDQPRKDT